MPAPRTVVQTMIAVLLLVAVFPVFAGLGGVSGSATVNATTSQSVTLDQTLSDVPDSVTVEATTGNALAFDGSDSVDMTGPTDFDNGSWTICAAAQLDDGVSQNGTYDVWAYENETILLQYDAGQWSVYYNNSTASAKAEINAPSPSIGFAAVCGRYEASTGTLTVARNGSLATDSMDQSVERRNLSAKWNGTLDEVRGFDQALADSELQTYGSDPIEPLPGTGREFRLMFDEGSGSETAVYFGSGPVGVDGASWTDGVAGPTLTRGTDYQLKTSPFGIAIVAGGYLEGAPVEHVSWTGNRVPLGLGSIITLFAALLILVGIAAKLTNL